MGRTKIEVSSKELQKHIDKLESEQRFSNRNELAIALEQTEWAKNYSFNGIQKAITKSVIINRIQEFSLTVKTPKGKRGKRGGKLTDEQKEAMQKGRTAKVDSGWIKELKQNTPSQYLPIIEKIENNSLKALLRLKCLECANYNISEIRNCEIKSCAIWGKRAYK